ncbi:MAG: hypothetical protein Q9187_004309 [Circinaria calcarea]
MASELIVQLATTIATKTAKVHEYLAANKLPPPSFEIDASWTSTVPPEAKDIESARQDVIDAATKLRILMLGPTDYLLSHTPDDLLSLHAIYRFKLASSFPIDEEASFEQIAAVCGLSEPDTRRFLRHAMTKHIFHEPRKGIVAHTALSRLLAETHSYMLVDIGGSLGFVCSRLAQSFPYLNFVVQDLPSAIESGRTQLPPELSDRIKFMAHDFLTEQPVRGADVYLFRWVLHNWSDKYAVQILRNLIPALKQGARILINDLVLPEPGVLPAWPEERLRSIDLTMLVIQNSRERELDDWKKLFEIADAGFRFVGAKQPAGSNLSLIEAVWEPAV